ncbi:hypothetical protein [Allorhizocola rhizosphaerae]|uniref:hypothetical protein n=1 Tax=Allorhizocola rhizosphaerae TaxID=1872709 RepID=UPI000E3EC46D|nr:hypothetical protein [Allorhizocola rhizosphaerae]
MTASPTQPDLSTRTGSIITAAIIALAGCTAPVSDPNPPAPAKQQHNTQANGTTWQQATIELPVGSGMDCPTGRTQLSPAQAPSGLTAWAKGDGPANNFTADVPALASGDLNGDGASEMVLRVRCTSLEPSQEQDPGLPGQLLVVKAVSDTHLVGLGYVGPAYARYLKAEVLDGQLRTQVWYESERSTSIYAPAHMRIFKLNGTNFTQVNGRTAPLVLSAAKAGQGSPVTLPGIHADQSVTCAASNLVFEGGQARTPDATYGVTGNAQLVDVDSDGNQELLTEISCTTSGATRTSLYLLRQDTNALVAIDVPVANNGMVSISNGWKFTGNVLTVTTTNLQSGEQQKHTMNWVGDGFSGKVGSFG